MTVFTQQLANGGNDGCCATSFGYSTTLAYVRMGHWGIYGTGYSFYRFTNVTIPPGSTINSAAITFCAYDSQSSTTCNLIFYGVDADNAGQPSVKEDITGATLTTASVAWNSVGSWTGGSDYTGPDIANIIQEIIDRVGWASGNALIVQVRDNGSTSGRYRNAQDVSNGWPSNTAYLAIDYDPPISGKPYYAYAQQ